MSSLPPTGPAHDPYAQATPAADPYAPGAQPPAPYGQAPYGQAPYGQAAYGQAPYGQAPYGQAPYGQTPYGQAPHGGYPGAPELASWGRRVGAFLLDELVALVPYMAFGAGALANSEPGVDAYGNPTTNPTGVGVVFLLLAMASLAVVWVWNRGVLQGRTGQSLAKRWLGIRLVDASTGQPLGTGRALLRDVCHIADGFFYLGYLWPLWDARKQTFADKIVGTVVVRSA